MSERMSEDMSERMSEDMSERMSEDKSEEMSERYVRRYVRKNVKRYVRKNVRRYVRKNVKRYVRKNVRRYAQKECQKICPKECREISQKILAERMSKDMSEKECQKICQKECQKICQKECQKICQKKCQKDMSEDMSEIMSKDLSERMAKDTSERCQKECQKICQKECQKICQAERQIWITRIHVCTNGILWMASCFLFYLAYCSKYCWLNFVFVQGSEFGLEAMAEVVVERPETIFIGTANQVAKGVEHVWRYKLTFVGAERMYVCMEPPSTTHAGDLMFIMEEVVEGNKWYMAYEGRPVPNAEGEQELEKRAAVFRTSASFWEDGVHEWQTNNVRSRATYAEPAQAPQWRASDFMVCTRHEM